MGCMVLRGSRGRPFNAPAAFIHPCQPIVAKQHPTGHGWAHELKHDGYRLQIYVRDCASTPSMALSKRVDAPYRSGPSKTWIKVKTPTAPAAARAIDETF